MPSDEEFVLSRSETIALVAKLTEAIYVAHIYCGKATISMAAALDMATTTAGAIQADGTIARVDDARADPVTCLAQIDRRRTFANRKVDIDQNQKIDLLATALDRERSQRDTDQSPV